jgi:DNA-binding transcriptional LysR family regulator
LSGPLSIAASSTPGEFLVPRLVAGFTAGHPDVRPSVFTTDSEEVCREILERRWELGFVGARIKANGLRFDAVAQDEIVLAVPADHGFAGAGDVPLERLAAERFVDREGGSGTVLSVRRALAERGLVLPPYRVSMTLSTTQAIVAAVRAGYGIGFVSSLALPQPPDGRVVAVRLAGIPLRRTLYMVREKRSLPSPVARRFAEYVLAEAARRSSARRE